MKTNIFYNKNICIEVRKNPDGTLLLTNNGVDSIANAGSFIGGYGGVENFLSKCTEFEGTFEDFHAKWIIEQEERREHDKVIRENQKKREVERVSERAKLYKEEFDKLCKSGVIETTVDNIGIVLRYLNTCNWGSWNLPAMSISYTAHQYDCDGKTASTIKLDQPISDLDKGIENETMFVVGAPHGHLTRFRRIR